MLSRQVAIEMDCGSDVYPISASLVHLLQQVAASGYQFITPTPVTHQRVLAQRDPSGTTLRDIFGWNLPFAPDAIAPDLLTAMNHAGILQSSGSLLRSTVRIATLDADAFLHSAYPTTQDTAVFFGPDSYRFARFIRNALQAANWNIGTTAAGDTAPLRILDVGCGSGVGGIVAARQFGPTGIPLVVTMNDINPLALDYTSINAQVAGVPVVIAQGDALSAVEGEFDLIISNPPFLDDAAARTYRHGGARLGRALSVRIAEQALGRLALGGHLLLYTGVAIVEGVDPFLAELLPLLRVADYEWSYDEIDPDIFGEEILRPIYAHADRIAAVGLIVLRKS